MYRTRHISTLIIMLFLLVWSGAAHAQQASDPAAEIGSIEADDASSETDAANIRRLEQRLTGIRQRIGDSGGGMLARHGEELRRLETTIDSGDYRRFADFVEQGIIEPWSSINVEGIRRLAALNPGSLEAEEKILIKVSERRVRRIYGNLRRVRRLLTRIERLHEESVRGDGELRRLRRHYQRLLEEYEQLRGTRAEAERNWLESELNPRLRQLQTRQRLGEEKLRRLQSWTERPGLHTLLNRLNEINETLSRLKRLYGVKPGP